jgi:O-antigen/teichoic acid export membrane protein
MEAGRRITTNAIILVVLRLTRPFLSMALVVGISRLLGAEELGRYTLALSVLIVFYEIAPLGLSAWIAREGSRSRQRLEELLATASSVVVILSLVLTALMCASGYVLRYDPTTTTAIILLALALAPAALNFLFEGTFVACERMDSIAIAALSENLFKVGGSFVVLLLGYGLHAVVLVVAGSYVVAAATSVLLLRRLGIRVRCGWHAEVLRELRRVAPTFLLISIFATLSWRVGIFLLGSMRSVEEVGQYGAAWRLLELALIFPQSLCLALYPSMSAARDDQVTLGWLGDTAARYLAAGSIPAAIGLSLLARPVLVLLFGEEFAAADDTLVVLIWVVVPYAWVRFNAYALVAAERQHIDLMFNAAMTALNVVLNLILIPRYGSLGAAMALLAAMTAHLLAQHVYLRRHLSGRAAPLRSDPAVLVAAVVLAACVYVLKETNFWSAAILGGGAYGLVLLCGGFFHRNRESLTALLAARQAPRLMQS